MRLQFEPISLRKKREYLAFLAKCPQTASDYSFVNIWGWAEEYGLNWAWDEKLVWIEQTRPKGSFWAPIGAWDSVHWKERFVENSQTIKTGFTRIPDALANRWKTEFEVGLQFEEERGQWDYLYSVCELVELKGNRFHKKKNLLNRFKKNYNFTYAPFGQKTVTRAMEMQTSWCTWRNCESHELLAAENRVIERVLLEWKNLACLSGGAIFVDNMMVAYTVAERLSRDMLLIHFEKGNPDYMGVYQAMNQMFLDDLKNGFQIVNREQDLNDDGLRKAKLSYHPTDFIRKYSVSFS